MIPADIRRELNLECGASLMVIWNGDDLRLQPVPHDDLQRLQWAFQRGYEGKTAKDVEKILKELHDEWPD